MVNLDPESRVRCQSVVCVTPGVVGPSSTAASNAVLMDCVKQRGSGGKGVRIFKLEATWMLKAGEVDEGRERFL